jgi:hypothetical protein
MMPPHAADLAQRRRILLTMLAAARVECPALDHWQQSGFPFS